MPSVAYGDFEQNKTDVDRLFEIHTEIAGDSKGRKVDVEVLNRTAFVLITACWESYVEDIAKESLRFLVENTPNATHLPSELKASVSKEIKDEKHEHAVWGLADSGWRQYLLGRVDTFLEKRIGSFNTPKTAQTNALFLDLLGFKNLSSAWSWQKMPKATAANNLDEFIKIRGNIAHRTKHDNSVQKIDATKYLKHVVQLVLHTEEFLNKKLLEITGKKPWEDIDKTAVIN